MMWTILVIQLILHFWWWWFLFRLLLFFLIILIIIKNIIIISCDVLWIDLFFLFIYIFLLLLFLPVEELVRVDAVEKIMWLSERSEFIKWFFIFDSRWWLTNLRCLIESRQIIVLSTMNTSTKIDIKVMVTIVEKLAVIGNKKKLSYSLVLVFFLFGTSLQILCCSKVTMCQSEPYLFTTTQL